MDMRLLALSILLTMSGAVLLFVIFPLACIWFSDAMGGYTGLTTSMPITATSPGVIVCILGWLLLLMPLIAAAIAHFAS